MSMIHAATLEISIECPGCKLTVPVNGVAPATRCSQCGTSVALEWDALLELGWKMTALDRAVVLSEGRSDHGNFASKWLQVTRETPACTGCRTSLPVDALVASAQRNETAHCPGCGLAIAMRPAPPELVKAYPFARALLFESTTWLALAAPDSAREPVIFQCTTCGAGIDVSAAGRKVVCSYCRASNEIPEAVWQRLHPPHELERFVVISDVDEAHVYALRYRYGDGRDHALADASKRDLAPERLRGLGHHPDSAVQKALLQNPACTTDVLLAMAESTSREVRDAIAAHRCVTPAVLEAMAAAMEARVGDADPDRETGEWTTIATDPRATAKTLTALARCEEDAIRAGVAANPNTPIDVALTLRDDPEPEVRASLATRADLPATVVEALAHDAEPAVRAAVAAREDLDAPLFVALARDGEIRVCHAIVRNPNTPAEALAILAAMDDEDLVRAAKKHRHYARKWWEIF
jgi:DNA-directed RNA polymerase subunit RPC12/RpoP